MSQEIIEKMDNIAKDIKQYQDTTTTNQNAIDSITKRLEAVQQEKLKIESVEKRLGEIDNTLGRLGTTVDASKETALLAEKNAIGKYLRYGDNVGEDINKSIIEDVIKQSSHGVREETLQHEINKTLSKEINGGGVILKSVVTGNNPNGGYLLRPEYSSENITRLWETSPMRSIANVMTTSSSSMEFLIDDNEGISGGWVGEVENRSITGTPKLGTKTIYLHEQYAEPTISQTALDDIAIDLQQWLQNKNVDRFIRDENTSFVVGDSVKQPKGFTTYPATTTAYDRGTIQQVNSGSSGNVTADGLKDLQNVLYQGYQSGAVWLMNRLTFGEVIKLKNSQNDYLLDFNSLKVGDTMTLLGKPVIFASDMPVSQADSLSVAYGDFRRGYTILDGIGVRVIRDPYTAKPYVKYYTTKRVGGDVTNYQAIKLLKLAN